MCYRNVKTLDLYFVMGKHIDVKYLLLVFAFTGMITSCSDEKVDDDDTIPYTYNPTYVTIPSPEGFPAMTIPADNPFTKEGIQLGKMLFFDPILSGDSTLACAGCHFQSFGFTDMGKKVSTGIDGISGSRNAMPLFNLGFMSSFFWDGRAATLEELVLIPVEDPIEMHEEWPNNITKIKRHALYPELFYNAFGTTDINKEHAAKAISQFLRTIISGNSPYDKQKNTPGGYTGWTDEMEYGRELFFGEPNAGGADCFHCHVDVLFQNVNQFDQFRNNGLVDAQNENDFSDKGRGGVTGKPSDNGKMKVPSLRNLLYTAPYMHDGRFATLEEVIEFYDHGVHLNAANLDPLMLKPGKEDGLNLSDEDKKNLLEFLKSLSDEAFINNPDYASPF